MTGFADSKRGTRHNSEIKRQNRDFMSDIRSNRMKEEEEVKEKNLNKKNSDEKKKK